MLRAGTAIYLLVPTASNRRVLEPGRALEADATMFVGEFDETVAPAVGADVNVCFEFRGKFLQQGAAVVEVRTSAKRPVIVFRRVGKPISAEQRGTYRVSIAADGVQAKIEQENNCLVVDISPEGVGAIATGNYPLGSLVTLSLNHQGQQLIGQARVQTARRRPDGRFRYGFLVLEGPMRKAMEQISASMQRLHLQRISRVA